MLMCVTAILLSAPLADASQVSPDDAVLARRMYRMVLNETSSATAAIRAVAKEFRWTEDVAKKVIRGQAPPKMDPEDSSPKDTPQEPEPPRAPKDNLPDDVPSVTVTMRLDEFDEVHVVELRDESQKGTIVKVRAYWGKDWKLAKACHIEIETTSRNLHYRVTPELKCASTSGAFAASAVEYSSTWIAKGAKWQETVTGTITGNDLVKWATAEPGGAKLRVDKDAHTLCPQAHLGLKVIHGMMTSSRVIDSLRPKLIQRHWGPTELLRSTGVKLY